jgi:hypothetical protein
LVGLFGDLRFSGGPQAEIKKAHGRGQHQPGDKAAVHLGLVSREKGSIFGAK